MNPIMMRPLSVIHEDNAKRHSSHQNSAQALFGLWNMYKYHAMYSVQEILSPYL